MAVKKGSLDQFLNVSSMYSDNNKHLRSIFIDKEEHERTSPDSPIESVKNPSYKNDPQLEHNWNTIGTQKTDTPLNHNVQNTGNTDLNGTQLEHNKDTIGTQLEHIKNTSGTQLEHKTRDWDTIGTQLEHAKEHNKEHIRNTIGTQLEHNQDTKFGLSYLTGIQKQIILLFYNSCKKNRSYVTTEFSLENIANALNIRIGSIKTSLRRLEEKGFIRGKKFKKGRGGWTQFELLDEAYRELLENEKEHNWNTIGAQLEHKWDTYRNTQKDTSPSSSSSSIIKTTTTPISDEWDFDLSPYAGFGFGTTQLKQLVSLKTIAASDVEQSLIEFNHDIENNALPKIKTNKINFLMGLFRSGTSYISESYRNEQNHAIKAMAERAIQKRKAQLEEKCMAWEHQLTDKERDDIISRMPTHLIVLYKTNGLHQDEVKNWLVDYYLKKCSM